MTTTAARPLQRILGLGFGLVLAFGNTVGVGILRLPGTLAGALGDSRLVVLFGILGGLYALLGAFAVAELAAVLRGTEIEIGSRELRMLATSMALGWSAPCASFSWRCTVTVSRPTRCITTSSPR
jgi:basic amino acid/polyamine antiporter, APA family